MQEVGRAWQSMTEADRKYFKDKADKDKTRYLAESRTFYDEVAAIGASMGDQVNKQDSMKQALKKGGGNKVTLDASNSMAAAADEPQVGKKRLAP